MIYYYFLLSFVAVGLIFIMVLIKPINSNTISFLDKLFVTVAFFCSCIFGISIAIYPNWWKKNTNKTSNFQKSKASRSFKGHHPDCNMFESHIVIIGNKPRCAGCLGLLIGAITSIFLITFYLFLPYRFSITLFYIVFIIGIFVLFFVYTEIAFFKRKNFFHILLNILLVLSFLAITISVLEISKNLIYGILTVVLCFLWLDTRIHISNYKHMRICSNCIQDCKSY
jgi:hypothetical protein